MHQETFSLLRGLHGLSVSDGNSTSQKDKNATRCFSRVDAWNTASVPLLYGGLAATLPIHESYLEQILGGSNGRDIQKQRPGSTCIPSSGFPSGIVRILVSCASCQTRQKLIRQRSLPADKMPMSYDCRWHLIMFSLTMQQ